MNLARLHRRSGAAALLLAGLCASGAALAVERVKVADAPAGSVPAESERKLRLRGFAGDLRVRLGKPGEIRYRSARLGAAGEDLPVEVWKTGSALEMLPREGSTESRLLEVLVPPAVFVEVEAKDAKLLVQGLRAGFDLRGERLRLEARDIAGPVAIEGNAGSGVLERLDGDLSVRGTGLELRSVRSKGRIRLDVLNSRVEITGATGPFEGELQETTLQITGLAGTLQLKAAGGSAELKNIEQGAALSFSKTPLFLRESRGDIDIQTDADVHFENTDADLHVDSYGGSVFGNGNTGLLEVKTEGAEVSVDQVSGPTRVGGRRLKVVLQNVGGEIFVEASASEITIGDPLAEVLVISENAKVTVIRPATDVEVKSVGGDLRIFEVHGPLLVESDCNRVEVTLAAPFALKDGSIRNDGGDVALRIPPGLGILLVAESRTGRIESSIPGVPVSDGASTAQAEIGRQGADRSTLRVFASHDILLETP